MTQLGMAIHVYLVLIIWYMVRDCFCLECYECSDTFKAIWEPKVCQMNATAVPTRHCNEDQPYCFVKRVATKGIVSEIVRDCTEDCRYGCEANSFGITKITCVSCCDVDKCNSGNEGRPYVSATYDVFLYSLSISYYVINFGL